MKLMLTFFTSLIFSVATFAANEPFQTFLLGSPTASSLTGNEIQYCSQGGVSKQCTINLQLSFFNANGTPNLANGTGTVPCSSLPALSGVITSSGCVTSFASGGGSIPSTTDVLTGNGSGGAADSGVALDYLSVYTSLYLGIGLPTTSTGIGNTTFGIGAGSSLTTGSGGQGDTLIGFHAGNACTTCRETVAIGYNAFAAYTGSGAGAEDGLVVAIGAEAGESAAPGSGGLDSVMIGQKSFISATTLFGAVGVGTHTGSSALSSTNDTFVGNGVFNGSSSTATSLENTFIGSGIAANTPTGTVTGNTAIGFGSGASLTGGSSYNLFGGFNAGGNCTTCSNDVALGVDAGYSVVSATYDTFVGAYAGQNATGGYSTLVGFIAGQNITSGNATALGSYSCTGTTTGAGNICIGYASGQLSSGSTNVSVGNNSNYRASGSSNTSIGDHAGNAITSGGNNTAMGSNVASTTCATGSNDLLLGTSNNTDCASSSESNAIHIGAGSTDIIYSTGTGTPATSKTVIAGTLGTGSNTISTLPTCNSGMAGQFSYVTNGQTTPTYLGTVSTTGSTTAPVFCNGSSWIYH